MIEIRPAIEADKPAVWQIIKGCNSLCSAGDFYDGSSSTYTKGLNLFCGLNNAGDL